MSDYKEKKKLKKLLEDIDNILRVVILAQKSLRFYKQYLSVQEMMNVLETNEELLELHKKKYEAKLEEIKKKYSE